VTRWSSPDAPEGFVRITKEFKSETISVSTSVTLEELDQPMTVAGKELRTHLVVSKTSGSHGHVAKYWRSPQIPGGLVRNETKTTQGEFTLEIKQEALAFYVHP
jgi:hypothetical protein